MTHFLWLAVLAVAILFACEARGQVYQCPGAGGQKVFQQAPCTNGQKLVVRPTSNLGGTMLGSVKESKTQQIQVARQEQIRQAIDEHRPVVGMTEGELVLALGQPIRINARQYENYGFKQWVYRTDKLVYVYTENGRVTSISSYDRIDIYRRQPEPKLQGLQ